MFPCGFAPIANIVLFSGAFIVPSDTTLDTNLSFTYKQTLNPSYVASKCTFCPAVNAELDLADFHSFVLALYTSNVGTPFNKYNP